MGVTPLNTTKVQLTRGTYEEGTTCMVSLNTTKVQLTP